MKRWHDTVKTTNQRSNLRTLAERCEFFPTELYDLDAESDEENYLNIDLGLDQMEQYEFT